MFLIFDLDDTLIETSKCLTPHALRRAFKAMMRGGRDEQFEDLIGINQRAMNAREALSQFSQKYSINQKNLDAGLEALWASLGELEIEPVPGAIELLDELQGVCPLALVTMGNKKLQLEKMKKAGIQPGKFSRLIVGEGPSKKKDYERICDEFHLPPSTGIVCGDRVQLDLTPAKLLGMRTIHFRNGRGHFHHQPEEDVDAVIHTLNEMQKTIAAGLLAQGKRIHQKLNVLNSEIDS